MPRWIVMTSLFVAAGLVYALNALAQSSKSQIEAAHHHSTHSHKAHSREAMPAASRPAASQDQRICPVSGDPVNQSIHTEYEGHRIYFCADKCIAEFEHAPLKYLPAVYRQVYPQRLQVRCPVTDNPIDPSVFSDQGDRRVYFCCQSCVPDFEADPKKHLARMGELSTVQVHCPVSGHLIDPQVKSDKSLTFMGHLIYYCCEGCLDKFQSDPLKYGDNLYPQAGLLAHGRTADEDLLVCLPEGDIRRRAVTTKLLHDKTRYALCDSSSVKAVKADIDRYARLLRARTIELTPDWETVFSCKAHPTNIRYEAGICPLCDQELEQVERGRLEPG